MAPRLKRILYSIFTKLLCIILLCGLSINIVIFSFFHDLIRNLDESPIKKNVKFYIQYLLNDIGDPPNLQRTKDIAKETLFQIRYDSPAVSWSTSPTLKNYQNLKLKPLPNNPDVLINFRRGSHIISVPHANGRITFANFRSFETQSHKQGVVKLIVLVSLILGICFWMIKKVLAPIKNITQGVQALGDGELSYRVSENTKDELGELSKGFNIMAIQIERMIHAREHLLLDVSHELRSPITRIKLALEFIPDSKWHHSIGEDIADMEKMISEILENARLRSQKQPLNLEHLYVNDLIASVVAKYSERQPQIIYKSTEDTVMIPGDKALLEILLGNILENSLKFSSDSANPIEISVTVLAKHVIISIQDFGQGIPEDALSYIFEPFYRVDQSRSKKSGGYGLGLSLCKTIVDVHKGEIKVNSNLGEGTVFTIQLLKFEPA